MQTINESPVAQMLKQYRNEHNLCYDDIANITGMSKGTIKNIENGHNISAKTVSLLSKHLSNTFEPYVEYRICVVCGKKFIPVKKNIRSCSAVCSEKNRRTQQDIWHNNNRKDNTKPKSILIVKNKSYYDKDKQRAEDFEKLSRDAGMTYGERQKLERLGKLQSG